VPLAMLSPPKFASPPIQDAGRQNPPGRTPRKRLPQAAIFRNLGENRAGFQQNRSGILPFIYGAQGKVK